MTTQKKPLKIQIKSLLGKILFEHKCSGNTLKKTLELAVKKRIDLKGADLKGADLRGADLLQADLRGAYFLKVNLREACLHAAYLQGAHLSMADLRGASLRGADLRGADLWGADLRGAHLWGACLWEACLWEAKGIKINTCMLNILRYQKGKLLAFKYLNGNKLPNEKKNYKIGKTYFAKKHNGNDKHLCIEGLDVATLEWCLNDTAFDIYKIYIEVEFNAIDIVEIHHASSGAFKVRKFKIIRQIPYKELKKFIK